MASLLPFKSVFVWEYHIRFTPTSPGKQMQHKQGLWVFCVQDLLLFSDIATSPLPPHKTI
jgi:hypothetical protein